MLGGWSESDGPNYDVPDVDDETQHKSISRKRELKHTERQNIRFLYGRPLVQNSFRRPDVLTIFPWFSHSLMQEEINKTGSPNFKSQSPKIIIHGYSFIAGSTLRNQSNCRSIVT